MLAIRCVGLTKSYGGRRVVDSLDLEVETGEVFGFLGPNGSGKTTTTRMFLGLVAPDAGTAWILGAKVPCPEQMWRVGAMVEEPAFYGWMTGRRNLEVIAEEGAVVPAGAVGESLEAAGIAGVADRKVKTYSQGMRQRLGLAGAILRRPELVLLDEPANGLDPSGIHELRELLRRLADSGKTVFVSSHLMGEVEQVCDRVAILDRGRLVTVGTVANLGRVGQQIRVTITPEELPAARLALSRWTVTADGDTDLVVVDAAGRDVNQALAATGIYASSVRAEGRSLEDWFLALTQGEHHRAVAAG